MTRFSLPWVLPRVLVLAAAGSDDPTCATHVASRSEAGATGDVHRLVGYDNDGLSNPEHPQGLPPTSSPVNVDLLWGSAPSHDFICGGGRCDDLDSPAPTEELWGSRSSSADIDVISGSGGSYDLICGSDRCDDLGGDADDLRTLSPNRPATPASTVIASGGAP